MKLSGRVVDARGAPLARASVEVVAGDGGVIRSIGKGRVSRGVLTASTTEPALAWGLRIGGRAVLVAVVSVEGETAELGETALLAAPLALALFHAVDGVVHGVPAGLRPRAAPASRATTSTGFAATAAAATASADMASGATAPLAGVASMSFGTLLGSAAQQLRVSVAEEAGLTLKSASITVKGLPMASADALALAFPTAAEIAGGGAGLSSLAFQLDPKTTAAPPPPPPPPARVPRLVGYARELALRKLTASGWTVQVQSEIVTDAASAGRVVRQFPAADTPHPAGALVGLFVGKKAGE